MTNILKMKNILKKANIQNRRYYGMVAALFSFLLPVMIMLAIFIERGVYPFGDKLFLPGDLYHQYMPFFNEFFEKVKARENLDYSWNIGIGANFYALYVYYLASPFHWFAFLIPQKFLSQYIDYLIVFKTGLCGLSCHYYLAKLNKNSKVSPCFFTCFYALSGFMVAYNYNIMWLDNVILLPLIMLGIERLVKDKKPFLYVLSLGASIFTNYYLSIMICIFLVLYFVILLLCEKFSFKAVLQFVVYSLLAGGLSGILLVPEVIAILATDFGAVTIPKTIDTYFSLFDVIGRHCMGTTPERALEHWPNIYCGCAIFVLLPVYVLQNKIPIRKRFANLALTGFFLVSFSTNVLSFFWHGLNYPDSLPARQSFIYIMLMLSMCYQGVVYLEKEEKNKVLIGVLIAIGFLLLWEKFGIQDTMGTMTVALNIVMVAIYGALLYCFVAKEQKRFLVGIIAMVVVIVECTVNTSGTAITTVNRIRYFENCEEVNRMYTDATLGKEGFSRMEKFVRKTKNDSALATFPSATVFSSTLNSDVMRFYKKLGMRYSKVFYCFDGATAFTSALLNVDYMIGDNSDYDNCLYHIVDQEENAYLYEATYQLPFGYVAPWEFDFSENDKNDSILIQNNLINDLEIDKDLFINEIGRYDGNKLEFTAKHDGIYYGRLIASGIKKMQMVGGEPETMNFQDLKVGSVMYLGYLTEGETITLEDRTKEDETKKATVAIYRLDEDVLATAIHILQKNSLQEVKVQNTSISGKIHMPKAGRMILSVPAEKGWTIKVNGEKTMPQTFGDALIALDLLPGDYTIELQYSTPGKGMGILLSIVSILIVTLLWVIDRKKHSSHD